jgi:hypothetical protein
VRVPDHCRAVKSFTTALFFVLVASCAFSMADEAQADDAPVQRCEAADGNSVYTDKPCAAFAARRARISDDLAFRLAMANSVNTALQPVSMGAYRDASEPMHVSIPARRSPSAGCARSPQQLSRDLVGAFALHDVNRVAESYHWAGMSTHSAIPVMKQLERLSAQPLADARFLAAWIGSGEQAATAMPSDAGLMQLVFAGGTRVVDFEVRQYAGCYFIAS